MREQYRTDHDVTLPSGRDDKKPVSVSLLTKGLWKILSNETKTFLKYDCTNKFANRTLNYKTTYIEKQQSYTQNIFYSIILTPVTYLLPSLVTRNTHHKQIETSTVKYSSISGQRSITVWKYIITSNIKSLIGHGTKWTDFDD